MSVDNEVAGNKPSIGGSTTNASDFERNKVIANIIQGLSENPNGITKEEIDKLGELDSELNKSFLNSNQEKRESLWEEFTSYFYELINKSKTVRDISALMKIVTPFPNEGQEIWTDVFKQIGEQKTEEEIKEGISLGKNIIQAAGSIFTDSYGFSDRTLAGFYKNLLYNYKETNNRYGQRNKEVYPELYTKMLETLTHQLQKIKEEIERYDRDVEDYMGDIRSFLHKIPYNSLFKEPYKKLVDEIHSLEISLIEKKHQDDLKYLEINFQPEK